MNNNVIHSDNASSVSFIAFEAMGDRLHKIIKMLIIALVVSVLVNLVSNALWTYMWLQYDYYGTEEITETVTVDGKEGVANYANNGGSVVNGPNYSTREDSKDPYSGEEESEIEYEEN